MLDRPSREPKRVDGASIRSERTYRDDGLDAAKIAAIVLMLANHVFLAWPLPWSLWGYVLGRSCVPLFTIIMVARLAAGGPERGRRMLWWLCITSVLTQPIYIAVTAHEPMRANVLVSLAAGVVLIELIRRKYYPALVVAIVALLAVHPWLDPGATAPIGMAIAYATWQRNRWVGISIVCALAALSDYLMAPYYPFAGLGVLATPLILLASSSLSKVTPHLPRWTFYAFYPTHLLAIWLVYGAYP
jgi:hypothetical protein